jgi:hypothetical protein
VKIKANEGFSWQMTTKSELTECTVVEFNEAEECALLVEWSTRVEVEEICQ